MNLSKEEGIQRLLDRQEILDALQRYCRGVDRCDKELVRSAYHRDAYDDHGHWKGSGWDFAAFIVEAKRRDNDFTVHSLQNVDIDVQGEAAHSEAYMVAIMRYVGSHDIHMFGGRYVDRFERREGAWRIARRTVVHDWDCVVDPRSELLAVPLDGFVRGARMPDDLTYERS